ncbi:MAG: hypothetical protein KAS66_03030 [Candidatus Omnitrophica bacterium]|nr:hypothetical protein [Candidatus Omnitrophota bacterium]
MTEEIEVSIDLHKVPEDVGHIKDFEGKKSLHIKSMWAFNRWVSNQITTPAFKTTYVVSGPLPNCAALQIGLLLAGKGDVFFETTRKIRRKMDVE